MSHVYQPVMLRLLPERNGRASVRDVACALLNEDRSQLEYYSEITKNMVGRVLTNRAVVKREGGDYELLDYAKLTAEQVQELKAIATGSLKSISLGVVTRSGSTVGEALDTSVGPCVMKF
jgi:ATP adenylyltransferase